MAWKEQLITSDSVETTVTHPNLKYGIGIIIVINEQNIQWAEQGITHNSTAGTLTFPESLPFVGNLVFRYDQTGVTGTGVTTQTNGYNIDEVLPYMRRIGWINPTTADYNIVDTDNQASSCNRWYNDNSFNALCQIEYLYDTQPDYALDAADFNAYLVRQRDAIISKCVNSVFDAPQFIESGILFKKTGQTTKQLVSNESKFVGVKLKLSERDYFTNILNVMLMFDSAVTFNLYLYNEHLGKVNEWSVTTVANKLTIVNINEAIQHNSSQYKGGQWFLGYFQDDLGSAKAIRYDEVWDCFKTFGACGIKSTVTDTETFDMDTYSYDTNTYGLNVEMSVNSDLTQIIRRNAHLFDNLQGLMMADTVMDIYISSVRSNANSRISGDIANLMYREKKNVTTSENPIIGGLEVQILKEIKKLKKSFEPKQKSMVVSLC